MRSVRSAQSESTRSRGRRSTTTSCSRRRNRRRFLSPAASKARTAVYVIAIESPQFNPAPLEQIAQQTGGRYFGTGSSEGIAAVYSTIKQELARTWRIEYLTAARPGDRIRLSASAIGQGSTTSGFTVPGTPPTDAAPSKIGPKGAYGPTGPLGIAAVVAFLVLLAS